MLGERLSFDLTVSEDKTIEYIINFRLLRNLYKLTEKNPLDFMTKLIKEEDEEQIKQMVILVLLAGGLEENLTLDDIENIIKELDVKVLVSTFMILLKESITSEYKRPKDEEEVNNEVSVEELTEEEKINNWTQLYNSAYYLIVYKLRMNEEEFLNMTLREFKTIRDLKEEDEKSTIIRAYIDIMKARNKGDKKVAEEVKKENTATATNGVRIGDLLGNAFNNNN